jgi:hypothetical protein
VWSMINADGATARQAIVNELVARIDENFGPGVYGDRHMTEEIRTRFQVSRAQAEAFYKASRPLGKLMARRAGAR